MQKETEKERRDTCIENDIVIQRGMEKCRKKVKGEKERNVEKERNLEKGERERHKELEKERRRKRARVT